MREPLYLEDDRALWETLRLGQADVRAYFRELGQELLLDEADGFACLRQIEGADGERVPRLVQKHRLTYDATLLLVCLREELDAFNAVTADQRAVVRTRRELHALVAGLLPESHDQGRDLKKLDGTIEALCRLGFLKVRGSEGVGDAFEVRRVLRARFGPGELAAVKEKLLRHAESEPD